MLDSIATVSHGHLIIRVDVEALLIGAIEGDCQAIDSRVQCPVDPPDCAQGLALLIRCAGFRGIRYQWEIELFFSHV